MEENNPRGADIVHTLTHTKKEAKNKIAKGRARARVKDRGMGAFIVKVPISSRIARY